MAATMPKHTSTKLIGDSRGHKIVKPMEYIVLRKQPYSAKTYEGTYVIYAIQGNPITTTTNPTTINATKSGGPKIKRRIMAKNLYKLG